MADQHTMAQLLQAPTEGYEDAIVVPTIIAENFELKHGLLTLVQNKQFYGHDKEDPHAHIRYFNKITSTLNFSNVPNTSIKHMLFPFSLEGAARIWLKKEPPRSIFTWDDLVLKFINQFFPPSKTTSLHNEITNFQQRFDESFSEAWDRFKYLLQACPHHGFSKLHQLDTFYNALNSKDQDSLTSATGGNFLDKIPRDSLSIIESKSKVRYSHDRPIVAKVSTNASTSGVSPDVAELKDMVKALLLDKKAPAYQAPAPQTQGVLKEDFSAYVKANNAVMKNMQTNSASTSSSGTLPSNTIANPKSDLKAITTRSGVSYDGPQIPPPVVENKHEATKDTVNPTNNGNTEDIQPQAVQSKSLVSTETIIAPFSASKPNPKASIPYPSRRNDERNPLIRNKDKLSEMARTPLNEHCSAVLLKKLLEKLGDPGKFLIPRDFPSMAECLALADLGASINLMPFSVWKILTLPDLTPTYMTLKLADRSISHPVGVAEDVYVKVGSFHFPADFVVVDFDADPRVPLILGRSFLKTERALIDVLEAKRIDVIDMACEEYSQEVLGFSDTISSGNPTPYHDLIVSVTSSTLTSFGNSDFLLEEVDAFLAIEDEPTSFEFHQSYLDPERDILLLEEFLNDDPSSPLLNQRNYLPEVRKELKICDDKLPVIIAKDLSMEEETALITVLKFHKRAITWKLSDIKAINPKFCTHKILMEEDFTPAVQHQRRVNPKIHDVIKQEEFTFKVVDTKGAKNLARKLMNPFLSRHSIWFLLMVIKVPHGFTDFANYHAGNFIVKGMSSQQKSKFFKDVKKPLISLRLATLDRPKVTMDQITQPERAVGENRASWLDKLDDALWAFHTAYKTPIRCTPYKLVYGKACHLPVKLEHKAYWALKHANFDLKTASDHRKIQINKLNELYDQAYKNSLIYKEKTKKIHDSKIKNHVFNIGDRVLLFNSRLKIFFGKLKSRWSGPFTISQVYPYGTGELSQLDGPNFKVNGHRLKHYFGDDIPKLVVPDL
nr:reverse transcriptase domain-containing protein [Tanacetum cinerariifolium]